MEGIPALCSRGCVALDVYGRTHERLIVSARIVVGQVEVTILEEAVGDEEIMGLVSGEIAFLKGEDGGPRIVEEERNEKKGKKLFPGRPEGEGYRAFSEESHISPAVKRGSRYLETEDGKEETQSEEPEPGEEVIGTQVMDGQQGKEKKEEKRKIAPEVTGKSPIQRERQVIGHGLSPKELQERQNDEDDDGEQNKSKCLKFKTVFSEGKILSLNEKEDIPGQQARKEDHREEKEGTDFFHFTEWLVI